MTQDLAKIVHIFDDSLTSFPYRNTGELLEFEGMAPREHYEGDVNFPAIHRHYGLDQGEGWEENVQVLRNPEVLDGYNGQELEF